jgi:hypothetical protein
MSHEGCRIFWKRCGCCGAVQTSFNIIGSKEWIYDKEVSERAPKNVSITMCPECEKISTPKCKQEGVI